MAKRLRHFSLGVAICTLVLTTTVWVPPAQAQESFVGQIQTFGFTFAPRGFALCDGQLMSIAQNSALFSLLGTIYGGDGRTTFALPDLRGRVPIHQGTGPGLTPRPIGQRGGSETTTLNVTNLPSHNHGVTAKAYGTNNRGDAETPGGNSWASRSRDRDYSTAAPDTPMSPSAIQVTQNNVGSGQSFSNMPPYLVINYSIALVGIYPSRN